MKLVGGFFLFVCSISENFEVGLSIASFGFFFFIIKTRKTKRLSELSKVETLSGKSYYNVRDIDNDVAIECLLN